MEEEIITPEMQKEAEAKSWRSRFFKSEENEEQKKPWYPNIIKYFLTFIFWKIYSVIGLFLVVPVSIFFRASEDVFSDLLFIIMLVAIVPAYLSARWCMDKAAARFARNKK